MTKEVIILPDTSKLPYSPGAKAGNFIFVSGQIGSVDAEGKEVKVAMTFPGGTHDLWLRYWLAAGGIERVNSSGLRS